VRFLADENLPLQGVGLLATVGHEVAAIILESPGLPDEQVMLRAAREERVLLTFDRDHGRLLYRTGVPVPEGVVYFRFDPAYPEEPVEHLLAILDQPEISILGMLTVIERDRVRQRPLPGADRP
jgi:predicted nuclease of predicted toxin-antitoxin system